MKQSDVKIVFYDEKNSFSSEIVKDLEDESCKLISANLQNLSNVFNQENADLILMNLSGNPSAMVREAIADLRQMDEEIPIVCMTPQCEMGEVVDLMKMGIQDLIPLPYNREIMLHNLDRAVHLYRLSRKVFYLERQKGWKGDFLGIVGNSPQMQDNFKIISTVAKSNATVLILGESGTGKELVAKAIHMLSDRSKNKFIDLNCGSIPHDLLENELFGHEKGAYTGADKRYIGSFQRAHGGTIFLDEIRDRKSTRLNSSH